MPRRSATLRRSMCGAPRSGVGVTVCRPMARCLRHFNWHEQEGRHGAAACALAAAPLPPPLLLHGLTVLAAARRPVALLRVGIALEEEAEAVVAPAAAARNDVDRRLAYQEAALRLVAQHRDELGTIVGFV